MLRLRFYDKRRTVTDMAPAIIGIAFSEEGLPYYASKEVNWLWS
jgi:hypothetical protein